MAACSPFSTEAPLPAKAGSVLLVDDDSLVLRSLARALTKANLEVVAIDDPIVAMQMLSSKFFDAVLCDIWMPQMSGLTFAKYVRTHDPDIPVMLMTADPRLESAIEGIQLGILEYLPKPIEVARLQAAALRAVNLSRLARAKKEAQEVLAAPGSIRTGSLHRALDRAIATLSVAFQPIASPKNRCLVGYEALLRSNEPELPHPPAVISAAETCGRALEVGVKIRNKACEAFANAAPDTLLFLNIIPEDLMDEDLYDPHSAVGVFSHRIVLEVTERADLKRVRDALPRIQRLRALGYRIAVDDLGAGYAGLSSFAALEPEFTKLDMSLVRDAHLSTTKQRVVGSIVELCKDLGSSVVAEGIETVEEAETLTRLGCDFMQGYFYARPGPAFPVVHWP